MAVKVSKGQAKGGAKKSSGKGMKLLVADLKTKKGVKNPEALAAWIARGKDGKKAFATLLARRKGKK